MLATPNFDAAVRRAEARGAALGQDLDALKTSVRESSPAELASASEKRDRRHFLESLYDERREADAAFERIIQGNELQDASFLERGALVARTVMRVVLQSPGGATRGYGTGFLIGDGVLITNNHVLPNRDQAERALAEAFYERDVNGSELTPWRFGFDTSLFYTSVELDFTIIGLQSRSLNGREKLEPLGWLPLIGGPGKATEGEWLTIIQHPAGERKQLCVRENQLLKRDTDVLWYSTDTLAGSSGSPVFNNDWLLVALHHSGVPETKNGKWQTVDGHDYDPLRHSENDIKWKANEGIRVSRIVETLRTDPQAIRQQQLQAVVSTDVQDLRARLPVLYKPGLGPPTALPMNNSATVPAIFTPQPGSDSAARKDDDMAEKLVTVTLAVDDDGSVRVVGQEGSSESFALEATKGEKIDAPVVEEEDWIHGYDPAFLGRALPVVNLPIVSARLGGDKQIAPLIRKKIYDLPIPTAAESAAGVLKYNGYSVVMNKDRRIAFFSAANVNGGVDFGLGRKGDNWKTDKRIDKDHQLPDAYYKGTYLNRGHLTRREDLEWGTDKYDATRRANNTCTFPNCSPQHELFNQDKHPNPQIRLWLGLEKYILELSARSFNFRVQVFSGPIFDELEDPEFRGAKIPMRFWKVVVAVSAEQTLYATGYILTQEDVLDVTTLVRPPKEEGAVLGAFQTYQRTIAEIEEVTGLDFTYGAAGTPLSDIDAYAKELAKPAWKRRRSSTGSGTQESAEFGGGGALSNDGVLSSLSDIVLA